MCKLINGRERKGEEKGKKRWKSKSGSPTWGVDNSPTLYSSKLRLVYNKSLGQRRGRLFTHPSKHTIQNSAVCTKQY